MMTWVVHRFSPRLAFEGSVEADEVLYGLAHIVATIAYSTRRLPTNDSLCIGLAV